MKTEITQQQVYDKAMDAFGVVPGIVKELATRSEAVAFIFTQGSALMEGRSFTFAELNAIELKISALNNCHSCIKGHTYLLKKEGVAEEEIKAIIEKGNLKDERLHQLVRATENIYYAGSDTFPVHVSEELSETLSEREITEIIGIMGIKTIANYMNNYLASLKPGGR